MARNYSAAGRRNLLATSGQSMLVLLEITHPDLTVPARFVNDTVDFTRTVDDEEVVFKATTFELTFPDDTDGQIPQAQLSVGNVGRQLTQWLEYSRGGRGAKIRIMQVLRSDPGVNELDMTMDLSQLHIDSLKVTGVPGYKNTLAQAGTTMKFDPQNSPGLF